MLLVSIYRNYYKDSSVSYTLLLLGRDRPYSSTRIASRRTNGYLCASKKGGG